MTDETRVLYNAECPVCRFEIDHYRTQARNGALPIRFDDLCSGNLAAWGVSKDDAARRLHVLSGGKVLSGIPAFIALWGELPRHRWLGGLVSLPGIRHMATLVYDHIAAPLLYRWHLRRQQRG